MTKVQNIGVLTSGGDAPGMNACIRAITRMAIANHINVFGINDGFNGLIDNEMNVITYTDVSNIIQRGGTILGTARSERFLKKKYREVAFQNLKEKKIDLLIVIGGDGSFIGATIFSDEFNLPFIGIPGTIDNDIAGTDYTIGYDTALNTIISAVDKIRDTASSHHRIFLIEVMGNASGKLALNAALTTGSEDVFIPEVKEDFARFEDKIKKASEANKSSIIIVSEGDEIGGANELYAYLKSKELTSKVRVTVLGHVQRGGAPSYMDRKWGTEFGVKAVELAINNNVNVVIGAKNNNVYSYVPSKLIKKEFEKRDRKIELIHTLSIY